ncbi:MAG: UDP-glucose 4-epimerase GalE [Bacteroidota bacterium]|nr:UDP-glucose 4-epimerase GalE [Bacteroidota bacterium]
MFPHKILVTGGLGFIGSHTVVELQQAGYEVIILDDLSNSQLFILDRIKAITGIAPKFYQLNMLEEDKLHQLFLQEENIAAVIHFAAHKAVGESVAEPIKYFHNNLYALINLLRCMEQFGANNLVFSSSATVYGDPDELPIRETTVFKKAMSAYGSTKQMGEEIIEKTCAAKPINAIALRYFNPVGAHNSGLIGELPLGIPNNLMPYITQTAAGIRKQLLVYGNDYDTPDGTCIRDYIHVVDLAKAHVKSCDRLISKNNSEKYETYNIGTGKGYSVMEIINAFEAFNHLQLNYSISARRPGDAKAMYADVSKAGKHLGWKASLGLQDMVTSAWYWQQQLSNAH